jgi:ERCC4-type nuclease
MSEPKLVAELIPGAIAGMAQPVQPRLAGQLLLIDTREPWPHPWAANLPEGWSVERATMETGDVCLACNPEIVIERKTLPDFLSCVGTNRERFERELRRARHLQCFAVIVEADFPEAIRQRGGISWQSLVGTVAAWSRRYCPIVFAGDARHAAQIAFAYLAQPVAEARRVVAAADRKRKP